MREKLRAAVRVFMVTIHPAVPFALASVSTTGFSLTMCVFVCVFLVERDGWVHVS